MRGWRGMMGAVVLGLLMVSVPLLAHHGEAAYDTAKSVTVKGTVTDFQFVNPHVEIFINVKDANGNVVKWQGELTSPNMLSRRGWTGTILKAGDTITLVGYRAKNGSPSLRLQRVVAGNGKELYPSLGGGSEN
jgi:Family of unknown function (DUF6152)